MNDLVVPTAMGSFVTPSITKVWNPSFLANVTSTFCPALAVMALGAKEKFATSMFTLSVSGAVGVGAGVGSSAGGAGFGSPTAIVGSGGGGTGRGTSGADERKGGQEE